MTKPRELQTVDDVYTTLLEGAREVQTRMREQGDVDFLTGVKLSTLKPEIVKKKAVTFCVMESQRMVLAIHTLEEFSTRDIWQEYKDNIATILNTVRYNTRKYEEVYTLFGIVECIYNNHIENINEFKRAELDPEAYKEMLGKWDPSLATEH